MFTTNERSTGLRMQQQSRDNLQYRNIGILNTNQGVNESNTTVNQMNTNEHTPTNTNSEYSLTATSQELPFVQRIVNSTQQQQDNVSQSIRSEQAKVNLQVPSILSSGEVAMLSGFNPYSESSVDIYVHTLVSQSIGNQLRTNSNNTLLTGMSTNNVGIGTDTHIEATNDDLDNSDNPMDNLGPIEIGNIINESIEGNGERYNNLDAISQMLNSADQINTNENNILNSVINNYLSTLINPNIETTTNETADEVLAENSSQHIRTAVDFNMEDTSRHTRLYNLYNLLSDDTDEISRSNSTYTRPLEQLYKDNSTQTENLHTVQSNTMYVIFNIFRLNKEDYDMLILEQIKSQENHDYKNTK
jgi:hypothetical protein